MVERERIRIQAINGGMIDDDEEKGSAASRLHSLGALTIEPKRIDMNTEIMVNALATKAYEHLAQHLAQRSEYEELAAQMARTDIAPPEKLLQKGQEAKNGCAQFETEK